MGVDIVVPLTPPSPTGGEGDNLILKVYPNSSFERTKGIYFGFWSFGDCKLLGIWILVFKFLLGSG